MEDKSSDGTGMKDYKSSVESGMDDKSSDRTGMNYKSSDGSAMDDKSSIRTHSAELMEL